MITISRFLAIIIALVLIVLTTYMIWFNWNYAFYGKIILYFIFVYVSIVIGAICGEHILRLLTKKGKRRTEPDVES
jgi:hypothetical protein